MKSDARLESLVFQLTPTRTRCDLVATSNGRTEKIASGFVQPFVDHSKTARYEISMGGYSVTLQPPNGVDAPWFTKDTVEKFVRFVNTPEVLERVNAIEKEIIQIEGLLAIQGNECLAVRNVENHTTLECIEGNKSTCENDAEKAIVLYKPGACEPDSNGSTVKAENSKVQLVRVFQTRKNVLQKEQGMAFARAAAAGFDIDKMTYLVSFAECFGASRFLVACMGFLELWKGKHESGQWIEIEAAEAMSVQSDFSSVNASGIFLSGDTRRHSDTSNEKHNGDTSAEYLYANPNKGRTSGDPQLPSGSHEYLHGQLQHPMFPQWPVHCPPGGPGFQSYLMQGMSCHQNYPGTGPFFQHPDSAMDDPGNTFQSNMKIKRRSVEDDKDGIDESEMVDDMDQDTLEFDKDASQGCGSHRNCGRSGKNKPGMVVIRNINYITSKRRNASESETGSASSSDTEEDHENLHNESQEKNKKSSSSSKNKGKTKPLEHTNSCEEDANCGQEARSENWQVFQNFLLRDEDSSRSTAADDTLFSGEKFHPMSRRRSNVIADPMLPPVRSSGDIVEQRAIEFDTGNGRTIARNKAAESDDNLACSNFQRISRDSKLDVKFQELETGVGKYKRRPSDDFMICERGKQMMSSSSLDPLSENIDRPGGNFSEAAKPDITDESFIVPCRSFSQVQVGSGSRAAIDVDLDLPAGPYSTKESSLKNRSQVCSEPNDLSLMLDHREEVGYLGNDHAIDDVMKAHGNNNVNCTQKDTPGTKESLKKLDKEKKSRISRDGSEKKMIDSLRRGKPSRLNPLAEAQARAEKLRAYKADLQKSKKEKEEQEMRRLEALKRERQKRIAARGTSSSVQTVTTAPQNKTRLPTKLSPISHASSKFSDSDPTSSSTLRKWPIRASTGSSDSQKITKNGRLYGCHSAGSSLSRSATSLQATKADGVLVPEQKKVGKLKRLSDPIGAVGHSSSAKSVSRSQVTKQNISGRKGTNVPCASSVKSGSNNSDLKHMFNEPQIKKISEIVKVDRSKSAAGQELNTRIQTRIPSAVGKKSNVKDTACKANVKKSSVISKDTEKKSITEKTLQLSDEDDKLIVEKSIVIQEKEVVPAPLVASSDGDKGEVTEIVPESIGIQNPQLTTIPSEIVKVAKELLDEKPTYEMTVECVKDQTENFSSFTTEKPYEVPAAQASSVEDSSTNTYNHGEALPTRSSVVAKASSQNIQTETSTFSNTNKVEPEYTKPRVQESSKGFKRLWKLGRRGHSSASDEHNIVSECSSTNAVSSKEAPTILKTLMSEDDPRAKSNSKAFRSFSILSSFRSKTSEKKIMV